MPKYMTRRSACLLAALVLGGCGSSGHHKAVKRLTVPAYAGFPSTTITVTAGTPEYCRRDAQAFARDAVRFFRPFPSDADEYRLQARIQFIDFKAHLCDVAILRKALSRRLTLKRRRVIVRRFSWLGKTAPELTKEP